MKSEKEVDDLFAIIEKCGGTIAKKTEKVFWGGYSEYFQDPDGYYWEVAYASIWEFDEKDMLIIKEWNRILFLFPLHILLNLLPTNTLSNNTKQFYFGQKGIDILFCYQKIGIVASFGISNF